MGMMFGRDGAGVGNPEMNDSERRHADVVKFGVVAEARYTNPPAVRVRIGDEDDADGHLVTGWLPMGGGRARGDADWHPLEEGERVVVLSESGELQNGMVFPAALYSDEDPAPGDKAGLWRKKFADGGVIEYDRETGEFLVEAEAFATLRVGDSELRVESGKITISVGGVALEVSGSGIKMTGGTVDHDGKNVGKTHTHGGIQSGSGFTLSPQ